MRKLIWLSVSLFNQKNHWNKLIKNAISPFLCCHGLSDVSYIELNYENGENIRLSILTTMGEAPFVAEQIDIYFKSYFEKIKEASAIFQSSR